MPAPEAVVISAVYFPVSMPVSHALVIVNDPTYYFLKPSNHFICPSTLIVALHLCLLTLPLLKVCFLHFGQIPSVYPLLVLSYIGHFVAPFLSNYLDITTLKPICQYLIGLFLIKRLKYLEKNTKKVYIYYGRGRDMKMKCPFCGSVRLRKAGFHKTPRSSRQRYECKNCRRFTIKPKKAGGKG